MSLKTAARILRVKGDPTYPPDHKAAMRVPLGGSSCATCEYLGRNHKDQPICFNQHFIAWHGSSLLPFPPDEYCSDWYSPAKGTLN